jgi:act minimal PKS acyl carrier protein
VSELTIEGLKEIMREAAGEDDSVRVDTEILDTLFIDMGFDSLALLETVALIKRQYGVVIDDDELTDLDTPRALLAKVNSALTPA